MEDIEALNSEKAYKSYVGPGNRYDFMGATQFRLLTTLGLRQHHKLLDFGCGSLRAGKLLIPYLAESNYFGIEPNKWLVEEGLANELGNGILAAKQPTFMHNDDFEIRFHTKFDFIVAQSIFSHTNRELTTKGIRSITQALNPGGRALVTFVESIRNYSGAESWLYPGCTHYNRRTISRILKGAGAHWRRLPWFHPAQTWYLIAREKHHLPSRYSCFLLLGGEEVGSKQYKYQSFLGNRMISAVKPYLGFLARVSERWK